VPTPNTRNAGLKTRRSVCRWEDRLPHRLGQVGIAKNTERRLGRDWAQLSAYEE
jgi:hypothetical protein